MESGLSCIALNLQKVLLSMKRAVIPKWVRHRYSTYERWCEAQRRRHARRKQRNPEKIRAIVAKSTQKYDRELHLLTGEYKINAAGYGGGLRTEEVLDMRRQERQARKRWTITWKEHRLSFEEWLENYMKE